MTFSEIKKLIKQGKTGMLPYFKGYFKWSYELDDVIFENGNFKCKATDLQIQNRKDFYYIT